MEILFVRKHGTIYTRFLKEPSITTNIVSIMDTSKPFMVIPANAKHVHILW